jgi:sugar phosphate isomerase/epimerase
MRVSRRAFLAAAAGAAAAARSFAGFGKYIFGVVAPIRDFDNSVRYGFDYHEPSVCEVANMTDEEFEKFKDHVRSSPIRCRRLNLFTSPPGGFALPVIRVVGPDVDAAAVRAYVEKSLPRCRQLGAEIVVWGSGPSRNVPEGYSRERAWAQIQDFLRMVDPIARSQNITIGIESLRSPGSNILTTVTEVLKMERELSLPNIKMIVDYYQMRAMNEDPEIVWTARQEIIHIHFANPHGPNDRPAWPKDPGEDPEYAHFFNLLKKMGYTGGISIEAKGSYQESAAAALAFFRQELG